MVSCKIVHFTIPSAFKSMSKSVHNKNLKNMWDFTMATL